MEKIKNIIFDLGGIFLDIDMNATHNAFVSLGVTNFGEFYSQLVASPLFEDLETGKVSPPEFYERFRQETGISLTDEQIRDAWTAMLGRFPVERLSWLEEIGFRYKIYLFSNTNLIHYYVFQKIYQECTGKENFDDYFIKAYYSHDLGLRKPHPDAFKKLLALESLQADETLFIDDTAKNIEGAREAGLHTIHLLPPKTVLDLEL